MDLTDADFVQFKDVHYLDISYCNLGTITDAAFGHLANIHTLDMSGCNQIADFAKLSSKLKTLQTLKMLIMRNCYSIPLALFENLESIQTLDISLDSKKHVSCQSQNEAKRFAFLSLATL